MGELGLEQEGDFVVGKKQEMNPKGQAGVQLSGSSWFSLSSAAAGAGQEAELADPPSVYLHSGALRCFHIQALLSQHCRTAF